VVPVRPAEGPGGPGELASVHVARPARGGAAASAPPPPAVLALVLHDVVPAAVVASSRWTQNPDVISAEELDRDLAFLVQHGFTAVDTAAVADFVAGRRALPARSVYLTFDDGYESVYRYAFPLLQKYRLRATLFVIVSKVRGADEPFDPRRLSYLTWEQLKAMEASGLVDVQCHTYAMHDPAGVPGPLPLTVSPEAAIEADLQRCRQTLESRLGHPVFAFAYPHGAYGPAAIRALRATGFRLAFLGGSWPIHRGANPLLLPRFFVHPGAGLAYLLRYVPATGQA
jgi:peptidoglycan/xylan/chitin deacetylase (PgdA/CDA1 family)